ncbi:hypothetical protein [Microbacterium sp. LWH10-1.2]|uniref:hypothetical protein n=1 Tax=unclassified Microbacterium TaxID=2609290 RepID=UPI003138DB0B
MLVVPGHFALFVGSLWGALGRIQAGPTSGIVVDVLSGGATAARNKLTASFRSSTMCIETMLEGTTKSVRGTADDGEGNAGR